MVLVEEVAAWFEALAKSDPRTAHQVAAAIDLLERRGPHLGRPFADRVEGSSLHHLTELRPGSTGRSEVRLLFAFDHRRRAVILAAGDKTGQWSRWYRTAIPEFERRYAGWVRDEGGGDA